VEKRQKLLGSTAISIMLVLVIVIAINVIAAGLYFRLDVTEEKIYTLSDGTQKIVQKIYDSTLEDFEKLKEQKAVEGKTRSEAIEEEKEVLKEEKKKTPRKNGKKEKKDLDDILKPASSMFEPDPEPVKLPSGDLFVSENLTEKNEVYVRRMSSIEENMFYELIGIDNPKAINNTIDRVIENCTRSDIDIYELSLIDKFSLFFKILDMTYGDVTVEETCEKCDNVYSFDVSLVKDTNTTYVPKNYEYPKKIKLTSFKDKNANITWYLKYPTILQTNDFFGASILEAQKLITDKIEGTIVFNGTEIKITEEHYEDILKSLNEKDKDAYRDFLNEFGSYWTSVIIEKPFCENKSCDLYNKPQKFEVPLEKIFEKIIKLATDTNV